MGILFLGQKCSLSTQVGALIASYNVLGHLTTYFLIVCQFTGFWAREIHFQCQNKFWSSLTGTLVASYCLMGKLGTDLHVNL